MTAATSRAAVIRIGFALPRGARLSHPQRGIASRPVNDDPASKGNTQQEHTPLWQTLAGIVALLALVAAAALAVAQIYPNQLPTTKSPSFVDNIFDSRVVILLIRVALIFAAGYVVISVVGLIVGRRWLAELGPFKASEPIARLERGAEAVENDLGDALEMVADLKQGLVESDEALAQARSDIEFLVDRIDTLQSEKEED
jgi:hypothetical protein